jgi:CheY-like chemotaxis protein
MPGRDNPVILVADAKANILEDVSSALEKAGFTVLTALGSAPVLDLCARRQEPIRLAILDMAMPGFGPDLIERIRSAFPGIRIMHTSYTDESQAVGEFMQKPFRRSQLLGRVLQALDAPMVLTA